MSEPGRRLYELLDGPVLFGDFSPPVQEVCDYVEQKLDRESRERVLDEVEADLRKILAGEHADGAYTVRAVVTVLIEHALPKWREGP